MTRLTKAQKAVRKLTVNDLEKLQKEFYMTYDPDYWLYRMILLKNAHDRFEAAKVTLTRDLNNVDEDAYKRVMRTEMHFLYFQMTETLFEIIFALAEQDNNHLWLALTFSDKYSNTVFSSDTYDKIKNLSISSDIFTRKIRTEIEGKKIEILLLRWLFYFVYPTSLDDNGWVANLENIQKLLLSFARDFSDRGEYNAYKHSLRFYNAPMSVMIGLEGRNNVFHFGSNNDCITFLEERREKNIDGTETKTGRVTRVQKPFDFERDYTVCGIIHLMIKNLIYTRKYALLPELHGQNFEMTTFANLDFSKTVPGTTIQRTSFAV